MTNKTIKTTEKTYVVDKDRKFYVVDADGTVVAFRFTKLSKTFGLPQPYHFAYKRADLKEKESCDDVRFRFFSTIDDAKYRKNEIKIKEYAVVDRDDFNLDFNHSQYSSFFDAYIFCNGKPKLVNLYKKYDFINGCWVIPTDNKYYKDEIECWNDNDVTVIDFTD